MQNETVYQEQLNHMSAPHSDIDALTAYYADKHIVNRILAKNYELYARMASHEPLDEFDKAIAKINADKARKAIYPPIRSTK